MPKNHQNKIAPLFGKRIFITLYSLIFFTLSCITVNVYFPEGAVQRAADEFVKDLYKSGTKTIEKTKPSPSEVKPSKSPSSYYIPDFIFNNAFAADDIHLDTPAAQSIKARMSSRIGDLSGAKTKGLIGEANDGMVVVKDVSTLSLKERANIERIISVENQDRQALYDELQRANNLTDRNQTRIRSHFSRAFQEHSPAGTWVQGESGGWNRK